MPGTNAPRGIGHREGLRDRDEKADEDLREGGVLVARLLGGLLCRKLLVVVLVQGVWGTLLDGRPLGRVNRGFMSLEDVDTLKVKLMAGVVFEGAR